MSEESNMPKFKLGQTVYYSVQLDYRGKNYNGTSTLVYVPMEGRIISATLTDYDDIEYTMENGDIVEEKFIHNTSEGLFEVLHKSFVRGYYFDETKLEPHN